MDSASINGQDRGDRGDRGIRQRTRRPERSGEPDGRRRELSGDEECGESGGAARKGERASSDRPERRSGHERPSGQPPRASLTAKSAARIAVREVSELTGAESIGVTSVEPAEDGWLVGVEVVEERRIPSSADMLGVYMTGIGVDGKLLACHRTRRYLRGSELT